MHRRSGEPRLRNCRIDICGPTSRDVVILLLQMHGSLVSVLGKGGPGLSSHRSDIGAVYRAIGRNILTEVSVGVAVSYVA
jgi:hypothetical protein